MPANHMRRHSCFHRQLDRLGKIARGQLNLVTTRDKLRNQCAKKRHVRRVGEINPNAHHSFHAPFRRGTCPALDPADKSAI